MNILYSIIEIVATLSEAVAWITVILCFTDTKNAKTELAKKIALGSVFYTLFVSLLNQINIFSFLTAFLVMAFLALYSFFWNRDKILICITSTVIVVTAMASIDYILFFLFGLITENPVIDTRTFMTLMSPGLTRCLYLLTTKTLQIFLAFILIGKLPPLKKLRTKHVILLLIACSTFYFMMTYLVSLILSASILVLQTAVILSIIFIFVSIIVLLAVCFISTDYRVEKETNQLLSTVNALTEENYRKLSALQKELSKQNHDFSKHLRTIASLLNNQDTEEALRYVDELLKVPSQRAALCKSGNSVIDAIINSKITEAEEHQIDFRFQVNFALPTNITSVDICTILGNQLDNAMEACLKIEKKENRRIDVHIYQQLTSVVVFQVSNSVAEDPFLNNADLRSTKYNPDRLHGLGIQNIRETAEKYQGILENSYQNGRFTSSVLICFTPTLEKESAISEEEK